MSRTFTIHDTELALFEKFKEEHEKTCVYHGDTMANPGHIRYFTPTSAYTIFFKPTGVGDGVHVKCLCGAEVDITDYELW
jgi:hypothetical protein